MRRLRRKFWMLGKQLQSLNPQAYIIGNPAGSKGNPYSCHQKKTGML